MNVKYKILTREDLEGHYKYMVGGEYGHDTPYSPDNMTKTLPNGKVLHRIIAVRDIPGNRVEKGDIGGWVEHMDNLSQRGDCWISDEACVYDDARVYDNALVANHASVNDHASVRNDARVLQHASVSGYASVVQRAVARDHAQIRDLADVGGNSAVAHHAIISDRSSVVGTAWVGDNAVVSGSAHICYNATVGGNSVVCGAAIVGGTAKLARNAKVSQDQTVTFSHTVCDLSLDVKASVQAQCNLIFFNNEVICYKHVREDLTSLYDDTFQYTVGEWAEEKNPDLSNDSCAPGLHFSHPSYWEDQYDSGAVLMCRVHIDDIITVQAGKIRAKRAFVIGVCDNEVF